MRLDHLLSKDRSKGCVSGKLSCVKNPAPREMEDIGRGTGSPEDGFHLPGRTRREAPLDGISPKCGAFRDCAGSNKVKFVWWRCAQGQHPFSSRTRRLRPVRPMVLYWRRYGRAGGCQTYLINRRRAQRKMCFARARRGQDRQADLESDRISDERAGARVPGP